MHKRFIHIHDLDFSFARPFERETELWSLAHAGDTLSLLMWRRSTLRADGLRTCTRSKNDKQAFYPPDLHQRRHSVVCLCVYTCVLCVFASWVVFACLCVYLVKRDVEGWSARTRVCVELNISWDRAQASS